MRVVDDARAAHRFWYAFSPPFPLSVATRTRTRRPALEGLLHVLPIAPDTHVRLLAGIVAADMHRTRAYAHERAKPAAGDNGALRRCDPRLRPGAIAVAILPTAPGGRMAAAGQSPQ